MRQSLNLGNTETTLFNSLDVEVLQLNGNTIWEVDKNILILQAQRYSNGDAVIDGITYPTEQNRVVAINITSGSETTFATYDGVTKEVPPNTTADCIWGMYKGVDDGTSESGKIYISGGIVRLKTCSYPTTANSSGVEVTCLLGVSKWSNGEQFISTEAMFSGQKNLSGIIKVPEGITDLGKNTFNLVSSNTLFATGVEIILPKSLIAMREDCFGATFKLTNVDGQQYFYAPDIPENVEIMEYHSLPSAPALASSTTTIIRFLQAQGKTISLPTAGQGSGLAYSKNSRNYTIYTDNETIKNYDWSADNVVATIYHLDGTLWE